MTSIIKVNNIQNSSGTAAVSIDGSSNVTFPQNATVSGNTTISGTTTATGKITSTAGITFGSDTAASNVLDDYEEGTWTPAFDSGSGGYNGSDFSNINAIYRKIGNMVYLSASFQITGGGNVSVGDSLEFTGQPFTPISPHTYRMGVVSINQAVGSNTLAVGVIASTSSTPGSMRAVITQVNGTVPANSANGNYTISYPT